GPRLASRCRKRPRRLLARPDSARLSDCVGRAGRAGSAHRSESVCAGPRDAPGRARGPAQPLHRAGCPRAVGPGRLGEPRGALQGPGRRLGGSRNANGIRAAELGERQMTSLVGQVPPAVEPAVRTYSPALSRTVKAITLAVVTLATSMEFLT